MSNTFLIITSIGGPDHPGLKRFAEESSKYQIPFIVVGDTKSPVEFNLEGCDFYSVERQQVLDFELGRVLPFKHYARKNLGYLLAMSKGAEIIIETDDDNFPLPGFWDQRTKQVKAFSLSNNGWVNVYKYFSDLHIWPRGFALENINDSLPGLEKQISVCCPIQQGLAEENPDVDALYRLVMQLPVSFNKTENIALGRNSICPFNSQNTTWFKEAFLLMYLPSYCSFRMTDIWRSFIAQRIAWTCGWNILFHQSTVSQIRNEHNLIIDFKDEIPGYINNNNIFTGLQSLDLQSGTTHLSDNLIKCYQLLVDMNLIERSELNLVKMWIDDVNKILTYK